MKKNFTLLFSLIALVAPGQIIEAATMIVATASPNPVGKNTLSPAMAASVPAALASGLARAFSNSQFGQIAASQLTSNASGEALNAHDTSNTGQNHVHVSNVAEIASNGVANLFNPQGMPASMTLSGSNSGDINLLNNTASAIGSYVNTGNLDITKGVSSQILGDMNSTNTGSAIKTGITQGLKNSAQYNTSTVGNNRLSALVQPAIALKDAISSTLTTSTTTSPYYSYFTDKDGNNTSKYNPKVVSEVVNAIPLNAINMAMHESSAYNKGTNSGTTTGLASAMASVDNQHKVSTIANAGAVAINNLTSHSTGGVLGGDVIGGIGNYASNALHTINSNG